MSNALRLFLEAYLAMAASDGEDNPHYFDLSCGLCSNAIQFAQDNDFGLEHCRVLRDELHDMLYKSGLDADYPFGECSYDDSILTQDHHRHAPRIDWIKEQLNA